MSESIEERTRRILERLPAGVTLVAAAKTRTAEEVLAALRGGVTAIGHNYVQEAERMRDAVGRSVCERGRHVSC